jgi:integrase
MITDLTQSFVKKAPPPQSGQSIYTDRTLPGFGLRVTAHGCRSFILQARIRGRIRRITIGQFPMLDAAEARRRAIKLKGLIADGHDPAQDKIDARQQPLFQDIYQRWLAHAKLHWASWQPSSQKIDRHAAPLMARRACDVTLKNIQDLQERIALQGGRTQANRVCQLIRAIYLYSRLDSPTKGLKYFRELPRQRFLSLDELQKLNTALLEEPEWWPRAYFPLLLMLGLRCGELKAARWADINFEQELLTIAKTKTGRELTLPLPQAALAVLAKLPSRHKSDFVFPSSKSKTGHLEYPNYVWLRIRRKAGIPNIRIHDLRHSTASFLLAQQNSLSLISRVLNHSQIATTQRYAHLALEPIRLALETNARLLFGNTPK